MYSENNRRACMRRSDGECLRRMLGGELNGNACPIKNAKSAPSCGCGNVREARGERPPVSCDGSRPDHHKPVMDCPTVIPAPAIAMVYSPRQCWRNLLDPATGLSKGSIFEELILPLGEMPKNCAKEGKACRLF